MLKRLVRHRLFLTLLTLICGAIALAVPIRHDYNTQINRQTHQDAQTTEVFYGVPFSWISLSKKVDIQTDKTLQSTTKRDTKALVYDLGSYVLLVGIVAGALILDKRTMPHANLRY